MKSTLFIMTLIAATTTLAQPTPPGHSGPPPGINRHAPVPGQMAGRGQVDPMAENFFPPELIMQHQKALGLTDEQEKTIRTEMQKVVEKFTDLQWQQSAENETMASLLRQDKPDEKEVLEHLDKLLKVENEIKRLQMGLLVRIKNTLTPEQQVHLRALKRAMNPNRGPLAQAPKGGGPGVAGHPPGDGAPDQAQ